MNAFPRLIAVSVEEALDPGYRNEGRFRFDPRHYVFKYSLAGRGVYRRDGREYSVPAGSAFLCEVQDEANAYYYPEDGDEPWKFVYVCFSGGVSDALVGDLLERYGPIYTLPADEGLIPKLLDYSSHSDETVPISPGQGGRIVMDLLASLSDINELPLESDTSMSLVRSAQRVIKERLSENFNTSDLAGWLDVSREHLTRVFRQQAAISPYRYILRQKMRYACFMLKDTNLSNGEIAQKLGYDQQSHFSRCFKSVTKMTPSQFRKVGMIPPE